MSYESSAPRINTYAGRALVLLAALALILLTLSSGTSAIGAPGEGKGDFAGPEPANMRSFYCELTFPDNVCVLIANPGEQSHFVVTDIVVRAGNPSQPALMNLSSGPDVLIDLSVGGNRELHFETGLIAFRSLALNRTSGQQTISATVSGYYFDEGA